MQLKTKATKIMYLIQFSNAMLQSHYICQQTNVAEIYINYIFMIIDIDFSRADFISFHIISCG